MSKPLFLAIFCLFFLALKVYCQKNDTPLVINKKVKVLNYDYQYLYVEFVSELSLSTYYPFYNSRNKSEEQLYYEQGRAIRPGIQMEAIQSIKTGSWAIGLGVGYYGFYEQFNYANYPVKKVSILNANGEAETITVAYGVPEVNSHLNQLSYFVLPAKISYQPDLWNNLLSFSASIQNKWMVNTNYWAKFSSSDEFSEINIEEFRRSILNAKIAIGINKQINNYLTLELSPYYELDFQSVIELEQLHYRVSVAGFSANLKFNY